jgi:hypothetical protein
MRNNSFCLFVDTCSLCQEKEDKKGMDLVIYKNVFCHRGISGWRNCKRYLDISQNPTIQTEN